MNAFEISSRFIEELCALEPVDGTLFGVPGHDHEWGDRSPAGLEELRGFYQLTRDELGSHLRDQDHWQAHAAQVLVGWLDTRLANFEAGDHLRNLNHTYSTFQILRDAFDQMDRSTPEAWGNICSRLETFGAALEGYRQALEAGRAQKLVQATRQVQSVIDQSMALASDRSAFVVLKQQLAEKPFAGQIADRLANAIAQAGQAAGEFGTYLQTTYLPASDPTDGVGEERYLRAIDFFLGMKLDLSETYAWGWDEVARLRHEMQKVAREIVPGGTVAETLHLLETDPTRSAHSTAEFADFVRDRQHRAVAELDGKHFDVPGPGRQVTVNIAPPSLPPGAWYIPATEDNSRPGAIWYAFAGRSRLPLYQEVSTAYHEGFPGHHLQFAMVSALSDNLSRAQRNLIWYSGYGEGWALYAERLMQELGYFEKPDYLMGLFVSQLFRACRVVVDLGNHLGYAIPAHAPIGGGQRWNYKLAVQMMTDIGRQPLEVAQSEVKRYLGWPAQAISYKVGERVILGLRDEMKRQQGVAFDLKEFHRKVLGHGEVRLDMLPDVVLRSPPSVLVP